MIDPYSVGIIQSEIILANTRDDMERNLRRLEEMIEFLAVAGRAEFPVRLIVAPETVLNGAHFSPTCPAPHDIPSFVEGLTVTIPGPEMDRLGKKCQEHQLYFAASTYTREPRWPDRVFNTGFLIAPSGKVVLKYQKANTTNNLVAIASAPHDMWDEWTRVNGDRLEDFFPVVDTEIGKLGVCMCYDRCFPEVGRAFAVQGCEVLCNPTIWGDWWMSSTDEMWQIQTRAHAVNNSMYVVAPNAGASDDSTGRYPKGLAPGNSMIVDYRGRVLAAADHPGETVILATVNIPELRQHRLKNHWFNPIPQVRSELYAKIYEQPLWTKNRFLERPPQSIAEARGVHDSIVRELLERGVFLAPDHVGAVPPGIEGT